MTKKNFVLWTLLLVFMLNVSAQNRTEYLLEKNWKFIRTDEATQKDANYDDSAWQKVTVPHDWAIYGPFSPQNDKQHVAILQDGQTEATEHAGRTGGLPFVGVGWYRNTGNLPAYEIGKRVTILFDGAMANSQVWVNGRKVGEWPYGYNSFHFDITDYLNKDNTPNVLAVRLENRPEQSRWYPGAGIYRNVHVITTNEVHIPVWGTYVTTPVVNDDFAKINIRTKVTNTKQNSDYKLVTQILNPEGKVVGSAEAKLNKYSQAVFNQDVYLDEYKLWDVDSPNLYKAISKLYSNGKQVDEYSTTFGIRTIEIRPNDGFYLNGKRTVFKGVCMHHDLGPLGAAVNDAAIRRQIRIMKDMGVNAIRTSHNMPAPELVRACDEMGMMLMIETFDEWKQPKVQNGYNLFWDNWAEKDMVNVLHNYRNSPANVMWCIGNEVPEQGDGNMGPKRNKFLQDICHREDPTRPVTNGMDNPGAVTSNNFASILDVAGFNYRPHLYHENYKKIPQQLILGSETASTVSSRGVYKFPVERKAMAKYDDHQASSYDVEHCGWSNLPEDDFIQHEDLPYCIGEFVWTGFDYIGEPTPYYTDWPSHSSLFGIVDLAGIPKDRFYLYRSHWNKEIETLHILPHWNWEGREGEVTPVFVYTNYPSAELFINGKSQGKRTKDLSIKRDGTDTQEAYKNFERQKRYRLMWMDTKYEPGTVKVVAYDETGNAVAEKELKTAGKPARIVLEADRNTIKADGRDISFVNVKLVDKNGNFCPTDEREISFKVTGAGVFKAVANGNPASLESFQEPKMKLFSGQLTALVQSLEKGGKITLEASAKGVKSAKITIVAE
ncbi:MAG TPA: glycoside hydrolase family 2 protein [Bacteroidales bacterium]|nr:glycoside hydrolase family 2 protein [Bacteroidales bacterium]